MFTKTKDQQSQWDKGLDVMNNVAEFKTITLTFLLLYIMIQMKKNIKLIKRDEQITWVGLVHCHILSPVIQRVHWDY